MKTNILDIQFDNLTREEARQAGAELLRSSDFHYAVTPNPEFILTADKDLEFQKILNQADLVLPDGIGVVYSAKILGTPLKERVAGFDFACDMLDVLAVRLKKAKVSFYMLTGSTSKEKRAQMVHAFNEDDTSVFCISLKAGGTGLNLTAADIVIHYDPWWNLAVQNQATDRAHRIGQQNVVSVYRLFMKDTIEERIRALQERKRELADEILSGEGIGQALISREEVLELLGR